MSPLIIRGAINAGFSLTANSFTPFAANQYFDPTLEQYTKNAATWWSNFSSFSQVTKTAQGGVISAQKALSNLLVITIGTGPDNLTFKSAEGRAISPNTKFLIPKLLMQIFKGEVSTPQSFGSNLFLKDGTDQSVTNAAMDSISLDSKPCFLDILDSWVGIQKYNKGSQDNGVSFLEQTFIPNNLSSRPLKDTNSIYETNNPIEGQMPLQVLNFTNQQTWSILDSYSNKPVNEMYTAMKLNKNKRVVPTFIVRQNPLPLRSGFEEKIQEMNRTGQAAQKDRQPDIFSSSPVTQELFRDKVATYFDEIPDWDISSQYVLNKSVGKSGSQRVNFISFTPFNGLKGESARNEVNARLALPVVDNLDIQRNGLRSIMASIPSAWITDSNTDLVRRNGFANQLMSSIMFNNHLKLSGQITLIGIQLPIQQGDNVTIDGVTYHIERVIHSGGIQGIGQKFFNTVLHVSHGVVLKESGKHEFAKMGELRHTITTE